MGLTVAVSIRPGEKVGVIGDNGAGKSTLLRLMAGHGLPDNGELIVQAPAVILVTHDRRMRQRFSGRRLELVGGTAAS